MFKDMEENALFDVNIIQCQLKLIEEKISKLKEELGKKGYKIDYDIYGRNVHCIVWEKEKKKDYATTKVGGQARCVEEDIFSETLGKYLSLARAYRVIIEE